MMAPVNIKSLALKVWALVNASLVVLIGMELGWGEKLDQPISGGLLEWHEGALRLTRLGMDLQNSVLVDLM